MSVLVWLLAGWGLLVACGEKGEAPAPAPSTQKSIKEKTTPPAKPPQERAATPAPVDLKLGAVDGREIDLTKLRGKVVLVNFFGSWCPPCRKEVPELVDLYKTLGPKGLEMVGLALERDEDLAPLKEFIKEHRVRYPVAPAGRSEVEAFGGVRAVPTTFLLNRQGRVAKTFVGYVPVSSLEFEIARLLAAK